MTAERGDGGAGWGCWPDRGVPLPGLGVRPGRGEPLAPSSLGPRRGVKPEEEDKSAQQPPKQSPGPA